MKTLSRKKSYYMIICLMKFFKYASAGKTHFNLAAAASIVTLALFLIGSCAKKDGTAPGAFTSCNLASTAPLGANVSLGGAQVFNSSSYWNQDISQASVDPNSATIISNLGANNTDLRMQGGLNGSALTGLPYIVVAGSQNPVTISYTNHVNWDPGPFPIPPNAPIEPSGPDGHVIVIDRDNCLLYELYNAVSQNGGTSWQAGAGAVFDLKSDATRAHGTHSTDAAGMPIFPGLIRYDEVLSGHINHALRFASSTVRLAYYSPAVSCASIGATPTSPSYIPLGLHVRLKSSVNISGFAPNMQVILQALKTYGMYMTDGASLDWYMTGASDARWNNTEIASLRNIHNTDFEVIQEGPLTVGTVSGLCP